uniref:Late expression factor-2 n=1 Tax=Cryptophlebia leucotreta granulosis virus TaxID=35254 RepID=A0A2H4ZKE7_GVCL|nr:late expression factor-2 [Cryptophlebia leucotreta granulovirus]
MSDYTVFHPRLPVESDKIYKVDIFLMRWANINLNTSFLPGGRFFLVSGICLKNLIKKSKSFEEHKEMVYDVKKTNVCFQTYTNREDIIKIYRKIFYSKSNAKTEESFKKLCIRPRTNRYACRLSFNYLVVKRLQCCECNNICVYDALKLFYLMDSKCVKQVDNLVAKL